MDIESIVDRAAEEVSDRYFRKIELEVIEEECNGDDARRQDQIENKRAA